MASLKGITSRNQREIAKSVKGSKLLSLGAPPRPTRNRKFEKTWLLLLDEPSVSYDDPNEWRQAADVRPSSFPFCPRKYAFPRLGLNLPNPFTVAGSFYTRVGSAVHYVTQNALARTGRLFGNWKCARPSCGWISSASFYPGQCPQCGTHKIDYEELVLRDDTIGLRGHTDGLLAFKSYSSILEVKTAKHYNVEKLMAASDAELALTFQMTAPYYGYWHQASSYVSLVRHLCKTDPAFAAIPYTTRVDFLIVSRDDPKTVAAITLPVPDDDHWYEEIKQRVQTARAAVAEGRLPSGFASTKEELANLPSCKWCEYKDVCLEPDLGYSPRT
jgi:hypothetical protein